MTLNYLRKTSNNLEYLEVAGDSSSETIILLHGYGADAFDLLPLCQVFKKKPSPRWIFPFGNLNIPLAPGYVGKGWFPVNIEALTQTTNPDELIKALPADIDGPCKTIEALIKELSIPYSKLIIGGFSQGAILATEVALKAEISCQGLIILSGILVYEKNWRPLAKKHSKLTFFQSHGHYDPLLPFFQAQKLSRLLIESGIKGDFYPFEGGHEIPQSILLLMRNYLESITES